MKEFFETGPNKDDNNIVEKVEIEEVIIDNILFYNVKNTTEYIEEKYTFISDFIVSVIDNREFTIVIVSDNEIDRKVLMESVLNSNFE